jgi:hypothetical protein
MDPLIGLRTIIEYLEEDNGRVNWYRAKLAKMAEREIISLRTENERLLAELRNAAFEFVAYERAMDDGNDVAAMVKYEAAALILRRAALGEEKKS